MLPARVDVPSGIMAVITVTINNYFLNVLEAYFTGGISFLSL